MKSPTLGCREAATKLYREWEAVGRHANCLSWKVSSERMGPMTGAIEMKMWAEFVGVGGILGRWEIFVIRRTERSQIKKFGVALERGGKIGLRQGHALQSAYF